MSRATKARNFTFLITIGGFLFPPTTASAQCGGPSPECVLSNANISGLKVPTACPSNIQVNATWSQITSSVAGCSFSCAPSTNDSAYKSPECNTNTINSPPTSARSTLTATFSATDKNYQYVGIVTTVVAPNGYINSYNSPTTGTYCQ
jgi:hypothetical protein